MTQEQSDKICNMSLVCALMVVGVHMAGSATVGDPSWWLEQVFGFGLFAIAVPYFFIVSGYFVELSYCRGVAYWANVQKRIRSILVPFLIWNLLDVVLTVGIIVANDFAHARPIGTNVPHLGWRWLSVLGLYPFSEPYLGPLWYLRGLFLLVLMSPILRRLSNWLGLTILFVVMYVTMSAFPESSKSYHFFRWTLPTLGCFYFTFGMYLVKHPIPRQKGFVLSCCAFPLGLVVLACEVYCKYKGIVSPVYFRAFMIPLVLGFAWYLVSSVKERFALSKFSFPIYVLHYIFISLMFFISHSTSAAWYFMRGIVGVAGPVLLTLLLRRCLPRIAGVAFGGR